MAGFQKAKPGQAKLKVALYGKQGSGKTLTALLWAEGLAKGEGKRIAYIDTEHGTDFYCQRIPERAVHPDAFDFDVIYTKSIMEAVDALENLDPSVYCVVIVDSVTHMWEAAMEMYTGKRTSEGAIPVHAWGKVKKPWKLLIAAFLNGQYHAIMCGREGVIIEKDSDTGATEVVGRKMKAETEAQYEPHFSAHMEPIFHKDGTQTVSVFFDKDRSGALYGRRIENPTFATIEPILKYLTASSQVAMPNIEQAAEIDIAAIQSRDDEAEKERQNIHDQIRRAIMDAKDINQLKTAWDLTKGKKGKLGEELYSALEGTKDGRKAELMKGDL
jgi:hypothetical protein